MRRRRDSGSSGFVSGSKTVVSHSYAWLLLVQPLFEVENRQFEGAVGGIYLENQEWRKRDSRSPDTFNRSYPLLPAVYPLPACSLSDIYKFTRGLRGSYTKPRLVHIIDVLRSVVVL